MYIYILYTYIYKSYEMEGQGSEMMTCERGKGVGVQGYIVYNCSPPRAIIRPYA